LHPNSHIGDVGPLVVNILKILTCSAIDGDFTFISRKIFEITILNVSLDTVLDAT